MARESQGLKIAIIISVMLNLLFITGTILFWTQYDKEKAKALAFQDENNKLNTANKDIQSENNELKRLMGFAPSDKLDGITAGFNTDMETYAANYTGESKDYRSVVKWQSDTIDQKNLSLEGERAAKETLENDFDQVKQGLNQTVTAEKQRADNEHQQTLKEQAAYQQGLATSRDAAKKAQDTLAAAQQNFDAGVAQLQSDVAKASQERDQASERSAKLAAVIEDVRRPVFEMPDGKIRWVDQRNQAVWINLGQADGLARQITFSVYDADATDVTRAEPKGKIEVTRIDFDHLAEARILEDNLSNPIMPGDLIDTRVWAPGEREHFALLDGMDIDDDGKSDLDLVRNIIAIGGGVVDCWIDDEGNSFGEITVQTRYLVEGAQPDEEAPLARLKARTKMYQDATNNGLRKMPLKELLNRMGYKPQTSVVRYGPGASPDQFRPKPPEGGPKTSSGTVSDLFEKRPRPSSSGRRSAY